MSAGWPVFLFLFILGISAQTFNTFGIWDVHYPDAGYTVDTSQVGTSVSAEGSQVPSIFVIYTWTMDFVKIIGSGLVAVISLSFLFYAMGWPIGIVGAALLQLIQIPATLVALMWVFELFTGRNIG
jgi:hypothetical protein